MHRLLGESINLAQQLLHDQFPQFAGFQDTLLGELDGELEIIPLGKPYIQIFNKGTTIRYVTFKNI